MCIHPAIGKLNNGNYYAFLNGYSQPEFVGSLHEVEVALGVRKPIASTTQSAGKLPQELKRWDVRLTFQYPAWDEEDGIWYRDIDARSKSDANALARRKAHSDGHLCGSQGRVAFKAYPEHNK